MSADYETLRRPFFKPWPKGAPIEGWAEHALGPSVRCLARYVLHVEAKLVAVREERDAHARDLLWEREEHDKARTEWLLMRDRLNGLIEAVADAVSQTEPPDGYTEPWCDYGDGLEAAPWAYFQTLIGEALDKYERFDEEAWDVEQGLRREARERLLAERDAAERERDTLREALRFYADGTSWDRLDGGRRARAALSVVATPQGET